MKKKYLALVMAAILLCGCSNEPQISTVEAGKIAEETPSKITFDGNSIANSNTENMLPDTTSDGNSKEEKTPSETPSSGDSSNEWGVKVDADVTVTQGAKYGVYYPTFKTYSEAEAFEIKQKLLGDTNAEFIKVDAHGDYNYIWETGDISLVVHGGAGSFDINGDYAVFINNIFGPPRPGSQSNADHFTQCELDFCTREQAVNAVAEILAELGVNVADDPETYSISLPDLLTEVEYDRVNNPFWAENYPEVIGKKYECYYIKFNAELGGIPIYNEMINYRTVPNLATGNPEITAIYSANGLQYLYVDMYPASFELAEEITELVSAEDAAQIAVSKYVDVAGQTAVNIDKITLMYVFLPKGNDPSTKFVPAWICSGTIREVSTERGPIPTESVERLDIIIDARTGQEII